MITKIKEKKEDIIKKDLIFWKNLEKCIKDKKLKKMRREHKEMLLIYFTNENNKDSLLKIFSKDIIEFFIEEVSRIQNIMEILKYYMNFLFESKKNDISSIKRFIECQEDKNNIEKYFKDLNIAKKMNERFELIDYIFKIKNKDKDKEKEIVKTEKDFNECAKTWNLFEKMINEKKLNKIKLRDKHIIYDFFKEQEKNSTQNKIFDNNTYQLFIDNYQKCKKSIIIF